MMCGFPALQASLENLAKISVAGSATVRVGERIRMEIEVRPFKVRKVSIGIGGGFGSKLQMAVASAAASHAV